MLPQSENVCNQFIQMQSNVPLGTLSTFKGVGILKMHALILRSDMHFYWVNIRLIEYNILSVQAYTQYTQFSLLNIYLTARKQEHYFYFGREN